MGTSRWTGRITRFPPSTSAGRSGCVGTAGWCGSSTSQLEEIRVHVKQQTKGRFSTHPADIAPEKISGVERGAEWLLRRAGTIGEHADRWAQEVIRSRGIEGIRAVIGLLSLANRQPCPLIDKACEIAISYGAYHLKNVRHLIEQKAAKQEQMEFMQEHPLIRNLEVYGDLVRRVPS